MDSRERTVYFSGACLELRCLVREQPELEDVAGRVPPRVVVAQLSCTNNIHITTRYKNQRKPWVGFRG